MSAEPPAAHRFRPGQSGNPSGLPKNFRRPTDAIRHLVGIRGRDAESVVSRFVTARGARLCGADHLAITAFKKACDPGARNGDAAFREILDRLEGPVMKSLKVQSEGQLVVNIVSFDAMLEGKVSPEEHRLRALQEAAIEAVIVDTDQSDGPAPGGADEE